MPSSIIEHVTFWNTYKRGIVGFFVLSGVSDTLPTQDDICVVTNLALIETEIRAQSESKYNVEHSLRSQFTVVLV